MSPRQCKHIVLALRHATKRARPTFHTKRTAVYCLSAKLQQLGLAPPMLLSPDGRAALQAIAQVVLVARATPDVTLNAEWRYILQVGGYR